MLVPVHVYPQSVSFLIMHMYTYTQVHPVQLLVCMGSEKMNYLDNPKSKVKQGPPIEPIALRIVMVSCACT